MVPVVDFGRSFCTQAALRFDTDDPAEVGVPGNVCRAQILATCAITRWPSEEAQAAAAGGGVQRGHTHTFHLCQPCIGEHMYKEALPEGVRYQFQEPTSEIYVVAQQRDAGVSAAARFASSPEASKTLLRTGFASLDTDPRVYFYRGLTFVLTRAVSWSSPHRFLFVNFKGAYLHVSIEDAATNATIPHFTSGGCTPISGDTTRHKVSWPAAPSEAFAALQGRAVRFRFTWQSGSLFSFWVAESGCGASNGHLPGGGVGIDDSGFDLHGSCK